LMQFNGTRYEPIGGVLGSANWFELASWHPIQLNSAWRHHQIDDQWWRYFSSQIFWTQ
jgi:hypothetical protein